MEQLSDLYTSTLMRMEEHKATLLNTLRNQIKTNDFDKMENIVSQIKIVDDHSKTIRELKEALRVAPSKHDKTEKPYALVAREPEETSKVGSVSNQFKKKPSYRNPPIKKSAIEFLEDFIRVKNGESLNENEAIEFITEKGFRVSTALRAIGHKRKREGYKFI